VLFSSTQHKLSNKSEKVQKRSFEVQEGQEFGNADYKMAMLFVYCPEMMS